LSTENFFTRTIKRACAWVVDRGAQDAPIVSVLTPLIVQPGEENQTTIPIFDLTSRVLDDNTVVRSDGSTGDPLHAARYQHGLWRVAWTDGRLNVDPEAQTELIRAQAALTHQTRLARVQAEMDKAKATENFRKEEHDQARDDWQKAKREHDVVLAQQRRDPASFSRAIWWMYVIFAFFIMLADVPLSLLIAEGLGVEMMLEEGNPHDAVTLFTNFGSLWEAMAVALGVTALTIVFKLLIDRLYVRDEESRGGWKLRGGLRIGALVGAVVLTVYAFIVMGRVRADLAAGRAPAPDDLKNVFTILAVLFPIVAAFCLSMARLCLQNAKRLALATKEKNAAWIRRKAAIEPYEGAQAIHTAAKARFVAMSEKGIDETFLRELYTHAYERGWTVPETRLAGASLYERCEHLMHRTLARIEQFDNAM
jgi:hypothetical protein